MFFCSPSLHISLFPMIFGVFHCKICIVPSLKWSWRPSSNHTWLTFSPLLTWWKLENYISCLQRESTTIKQNIKMTKACRDYTDLNAACMFINFYNYILYIYSYRYFYKTIQYTSKSLISDTCSTKKRMMMNWFLQNFTSLYSCVEQQMLIPIWKWAPIIPVH